MNVSIQLDGEQISRMVYAELVETRAAFIEDMESERPAIFSFNEVYDKILIQKHIDALDVIIEWYKHPND